MSGPRRYERVRLVSEEAAYWFIRCTDERSMRLSDRRQLVAWMRSSPENIAEFLRASGVEGKIGRQKLLEKAGIDDSNVIELAISANTTQQHESETDESLDEEQDEKMNNKIILPWKLAAMVAAMMLTIVLTLVVKGTWFDDTVTTVAGQRQHIILDDGSVVHVGTRTRLKVEFTAERRVVHLYAGEAVFEVVKDSTRPFVVSTHLVDVTAVGTRFEVAIDPGVTTTVSEGIVKVTGRNNPNGKVVMLRAGERLRVSDGGLTEPEHAYVDADRKLEWANGWLVFRGETVGQAAEEFNRRNVVQIDIAPALAERTLPYYRFRVDSPESFAKTIAGQPDVVLKADRSNKVLRLQLE